MPLTVSTKTLSQRSGLSIRQVQTLTEAGVFVPDEGTEAPGRGGSRQYPVAESDLAMLLGAISHKGMSVTEALGIVMTLRPIIRAPDDIGFKGIEEARELRRYFKARIGLRGPSPLMLRNRARNAKIAEKLPPKWGHLKPTEAMVETIEAWITLELAKRGEVDPIMFLYRCHEERWRYEFWAILPITDDGHHNYNRFGNHNYRFGNTSIAVKYVEADPTSPEEAQCDLRFDNILIELKRLEGRHHKNRRGGYVIFPLSVYRQSSTE